MSIVCWTCVSVFTKVCSPAGFGYRTFMLTWTRTLFPAHRSSGGRSTSAQARAVDLLEPETQIWFGSHVSARDELERDSLLAAGSDGSSTLAVGYPAQ